jgi:hypothetical protein
MSEEKSTSIKVKQTTALATKQRFTSIRVRPETAKALSLIGKKGESYDQIISWLLKHSKKRKANTTLEQE